MVSCEGGQSSRDELVKHCCALVCFSNINSRVWVLLSLCTCWLVRISVWRCVHAFCARTCVCVCDCVCAPTFLIVAYCYLNLLEFQSDPSFRTTKVLSAKKKRSTCKKISWYNKQKMGTSHYKVCCSVEISFVQKICDGIYDFPELLCFSIYCW